MGLCAKKKMYFTFSAKEMKILQVTVCHKKKKSKQKMLRVNGLFDRRWQSRFALRLHTQK